MKINSINLSINIDKLGLSNKYFKAEGFIPLIIGLVLTIISIAAFLIFYSNGLGLAYNDARSHLDIGRRVVEGLKPGLAQLGSVWLPLTHFLMIPTIWNNFMWHSGLSGALPSMIAFVGTGLIIYHFLKKIGVEIIGRLVGVGVFALNLNVLYLQSTAMTELVLIGTMTAASYFLLDWAISKKITSLIYCSFFVFLSTLTRYDGWFLLAVVTLIIGIISAQNFGKK